MVYYLSILLENKPFPVLYSTYSTSGTPVTFGTLVTLGNRSNASNAGRRLVAMENGKNRFFNHRMKSCVTLLGVLKRAEEAFFHHMIKNHVVHAHPSP